MIVPLDWVPVTNEDRLKDVLKRLLAADREVATTSRSLLPAAIATRLDIVEEAAALLKELGP